MICLCLAHASAWGQVPPPAPKASAAAKSDRLMRPANVSGGGENMPMNVEQFIEQLKLAEAKISVVAESEALKTPVGTFDFHELPIRGALLLLPELTMGRIQVEIRGLQLGNNEEVVMIRSAPADPAEKQFLVVSVASLSEHVKPQPMLQSLEAGFKFMMTGEPNPEVMLHPETQLLFIKGTVRQVGLSRQVLQQLFAANGLAMPAEESIPGSGPGMMGMPGGGPGMGALMGGGYGGGPVSGGFGSLGGGGYPSGAGSYGRGGGGSGAPAGGGAGYPGSGGGDAGGGFSSGGGYPSGGSGYPGAGGGGRAGYPRGGGYPAGGGYPGGLSGSPDAGGEGSGYGGLGAETGGGAEGPVGGGDEGGGGDNSADGNTKP